MGVERRADEAYLSSNWLALYPSGVCGDVLGDVEEEKAMNNVLVYIPHVNIPIRHWVEGNVVKFDVPYGLTIYAEAFGIGIKYTEATDDQPNR